MTSDVTKTLNQIIDFCSNKWSEANQSPETTWPTPDMLAGKKMAYNDVLQFARTLLSENP